MHKKGRGRDVPTSARATQYGRPGYRATQYGRPGYRKGRQVGGKLQGICANYISSTKQAENRMLKERANIKAYTPINTPRGHPAGSQALPQATRSIVSYSQVVGWVHNFSMHSHGYGQLLLTIYYGYSSLSDVRAGLELGEEELMKETRAPPEERVKEQHPLKDEEEALVATKESLQPLAFAVGQPGYTEFPNVSTFVGPVQWTATTNIYSWVKLVGNTWRVYTRTGDRLMGPNGVESPTPKAVEFLSRRRDAKGSLRPSLFKEDAPKLYSRASEPLSCKKEQGLAEAE
ncbi:hypothetical protein B0H13DRAFT_1872527 [Mycena leptocephala]|nr:hypothetical protein B0H13DRAFT_1872527 [Mycena leptocephala]